LVVAHRNADLQGHAGGGGPPKELVTVDTAFRAQLNQTLDHTKAALAAQMRGHPAMLGGMIFRLRETGIAKSHRPVDLVQQAQIQPAGHAHIDEMLVGSTTASMDYLHRIVEQTETKKLKANLSAILRIEPWTRARRNPEGTLTLRESGQALLRVFRYHDEGASNAAWEAVLQLITRLEIPSRTITIGRSKIIQLRGLDKVSDEELDLLLEHPAVRSMTADQRVMTTATGPALNISAAANQTLGQPRAGLPTVAVFDTGVAVGNLALKNWVSSRATYVNSPDTNYEHGTAVASLVAGASAINTSFPDTACMVHDVCGLESGAGGQISDLILRLQDAVKRKPDVKVWNLSLGVPAPSHEQLFSEFSQALDQLSDDYGVLFVVASGNYETSPRRVWPTGLLAGEDRVSSPGEAVRALTVGSIAHLDAADTVVKVGEPAPYSRRGPGPVFTPKPDIVHFGGNAHHTGNATYPWASGMASTAVLQANGAILLGFGTSYAAPLASAMAAHAWASLLGHKALTPSPSLVKALMIHAAQLSNPDFSPLERRYYGAGLPQSAVDVLYDRDDSFTLVFEASLLPGNMRWRKTPYPIPPALLHNGRFRGEVIITAAYAPPVDATHGAEYVRANLEVNWGYIDGDRFHGKIPPEGEEGSTGLEVQQVKHGGKWAPVKTQRRAFPGGIAGDTWALQASMTQRAFEAPLEVAMNAFIVVTLRALDGNPDVHSQGIRAMLATNWVQNQLPVRVPIRV
jgi:serine protease AprX